MNYSKVHWPLVEIPNKYQYDYDAYLQELVFAGAKKRLGVRLGKAYLDRIEYELSYIKQYCDARYFLILFDLVRFAKDNDIWISAGRGRTVACLVCYCLNIDDIDPVRLDIPISSLFWRKHPFLPDVDLDVSKRERYLLVEYMKDKYGHGNVFQSMDMNKWIHPCSFFIVDDKSSVPNYIEFSCLENEKNKVLLANDSKWNLEAQGLLNYDLLAMSFLDMNKAICDIIDQGKKQYKLSDNIDLSSVDITDDNVYVIFQQGLTDGLFSFDSEGMKDCLREVKPTNFEELMAIYALYRPGMMDMIPLYLEGKDGVIHDDGFLINILQHTYGVPIYEQQILKVMFDIAHMSWEDGNILLRAIRKRKTDLICHYQQLFEKGCKDYSRLMDLDIIHLWNYVCTYAPVSFDRGHAAAYSYIAFQQAWLKTYYPDVFQKVMEQFS